MASINDLATLENSEPKTFDEWLNRFDEDDRDLIIHSIVTARLDDVYAVISKLDENPGLHRRCHRVQFQRRPAGQQRRQQSPRHHLGHRTMGTHLRGDLLMTIPETCASCYLPMPDPDLWAHPFCPQCQQQAHNHKETNNA